MIVVSGCGGVSSFNESAVQKGQGQSEDIPGSVEDGDAGVPDFDLGDSAPRADLPAETTTTTTLPIVKPAPVNTSPANTSPTLLPVSAEVIQITVDSETNLRTLKDNVLEVVHLLKAGDVIEIVKSAQPVVHNYRTSDGDIEFASTGFYPKVKIVKSSLSEQAQKDLNALDTGLYITTIAISETSTSLVIKPLTTHTPGEGFHKFYQDSGKPKVTWTQGILKRLPNLNQRVEWATLTDAEKKKWAAIMGELEKVSDRTRAIPRDLLIIDKAVAETQSLDFEKNKTVQKKGAWSIAVNGTAKRNGFEEVPCAEFVSEVIRQAYARAGYSHFDDFNAKNNNTLNYENGAAMVRYLSLYLARAGWIPWDAAKYAPSMGAIIMHTTGISPGHTYISAGSNGRFIIDNSSPQGRDLRIATGNTIELMYQHGVFFLPPGFSPERWEVVETRQY